MRISAAATVAIVLALTGCGVFGKKGDDGGAGDTPGAIDAAAVVAAPGAPIGKNSAAVARFATEAALNEPKMIGQTATPRTSPSGGTVVGTLKTGTIVTRIATNGGHSLIVFPDPNVSTDNLMGWVTEAAFSAAVIPKTAVDSGVVVVDAGTPAVVDAGAPAVVDAGAPPKANCAAPGIAVVIPGTTNSYQCRKPCAADADCKKGAKKCEGFKTYPAPGTDVKACHDDKT